VATAEAKKKQRSIRIDADLLAWLEERGRRLDRSVDWQIRQMLRERMEVEQATTEAA
jgi:hypothetical protein